MGSTWRSRTRFVREQLRIAIDEPYRTLLGHLRHEIGHYYFYRLVGTSVDYLPRLGTLFGDPDTDYRQALDRHYRQGAPPGWKKDYVSSYATMHPAEDWAETFAHYLHIRDTLDTAAAFGFAPSRATFERRMLGRSGIHTTIHEMAEPMHLERATGVDQRQPWRRIPAVAIQHVAEAGTAHLTMTAIADGAGRSSAAGARAPHGRTSRTAAAR